MHRQCRYNWPGFNQGSRPGSHFCGTAHTLARYENAFFNRLVSDWSNFENWQDKGSPTRALQLRADQILLPEPP
ncbi:hypothetical protein FJ945_20565 [Mesorhizobium sp. B2-4-9]|nr:hypothetical protein FJ945_20565 [Mesorhizobium sp. B2-4-9]